jgi:cystathionine beta-lyase family protein involved in aluminum resistance
MLIRDNHHLALPLSLCELRIQCGALYITQSLQLRSIHNVFLLMEIYFRASSYPSHDSSKKQHVEEAIQLEWCPHKQLTFCKSAVQRASTVNSWLLLAPVYCGIRIRDADIREGNRVVG